MDHKAVAARKRQAAEEAAALTDGREGYFEAVPGVRKRVRIPTAFVPFLTERQQTVLKGKVKMSKRWSRVVTTMRQTDMTMEDFVAQLSAEELVRGQIKDKNGHFRGQPPQWVPRAFHRACVAELMKRGKMLWQESYLVAIKAMVEIAGGVGPAGSLATPGERLKAAQFVVERIEGKTPERIVVEADQPWRLLVDDIVAEVEDKQVEAGRKAIEAGTYDNAVQDIIDAEVVEEEEPPPPPRPRSRRPRR